MNQHERHVVFGTGPLGSWTAQALVDQGQAVTMISRSGKAPYAPAGVEIRRGDAGNSEQVAELTQGAAAVYQCAQPAYHRWPEEFPALQESILRGVMRSGAKLIVAENLYMYGDPQGRVLTENTPYAAHTRKGRTRQAMTEALFAAHARGDVRAASARGSDFYGPYEPITAGMIYQPALAGKTVNMLGRLDQPHSFTYLPDFGRALAILGTNDTGLGRAWHVPTPPPLTQRELVDLIAAEIGRPVKVRGSGALILSIMGLFNPGAGETVEMLYEFKQPFVMDSSAFTNAFGLQPTALREAVAATVAWNRTPAAMPTAGAHA
ncbi:MAG: NAD-dependent epimerase/dehydratase family protein [Oscillochloris sp.]|nr:NAD-dependent epimerase/dehydratase family protein [Oscillochloris sp.]